jgi:hypothetical protein
LDTLAKASFCDGVAGVTVTSSGSTSTNKVIHGRSLLSDVAAAGV